MEPILKEAAQVSSGWSLAAFAMAMLFFLLNRRVKFRVAVVGAIVIAFLGALPILADAFIKLHSGDSIYRLRVTVVDPSDNPVDNAKVTNDRGGEAKAVAGGWQFDIPASTRGDGKVTVYAQDPGAFWKGKASVVLGDDLNPATTVRLAEDQSASVSGQVFDSKGRALANVSVSTPQGKASTLTDAQGKFTLRGFPAGSPVRLHFETNAGLNLDQDLFAGASNQSVRFSKVR
ncbi:carboxypeptidase regulatory-like domain-containing protein [Novosphingobium sp.]|uniref:carboxypeptidase regulatory-like domain-containing protein n=1 Tax=Novosphingobium sp. TaxID=1874826 RepID=UPI00333E89DC